MNHQIYDDCPTYHKDLITIRYIKETDIPQLLRCYSDITAVPLFNSDNCHGDNFHYTTIERMKQAFDFWDFSYRNQYFVRWSIIFNRTCEVIGTIEMFHRHVEDKFNHYGILRIDLHSNYETDSVISEIIEIASAHFYQDFEVKAILTKAIPQAQVRIKALLEHGYLPLGRKFIIFDDYYFRSLKGAEVIL